MGHYDFADHVTTIRLQHDNAHLLSQGTGECSNQNTNNPQDSRLASKNTRLEHDINSLNNKLNVLRSNMANYITQLDTSFNGWRLFTCEHANFGDIPDGYNSTRETNCSDEILLELLKDWIDDDKFIKEYNSARRTILQHHRAHERAVQGRGVASYRIKKEFVKLDERRGIPIKY
jgi:hypothetical protein